jgi:7tm Chemosensory receptor
MERFCQQKARSFARKFIIMVAYSACVEAYMISSIGFSIQWQRFWCVNLIPILACRMRQMEFFFIQNRIRSCVVLLTNEIDATMGSTLDRAQKLDILRNFYGYLWKATNAANDFFQISLVAIFIHDFVHSGCDFYWLSSAIRGYPGESAYGAIVVSATIPLVFLLFCLHEGDRLKNEMDKIPIMLHSLKRTKSDESKIVSRG